MSTTIFIIIIIIIIIVVTVVDININININIRNEITVDTRSCNHLLDYTELNRTFRFAFECNTGPNTEA